MKTINYLILLFVGFAITSGTAFAEATSGTTGSCKWEVNAKCDTLTISGSGPMESYYNDLDIAPPWKPYRNSLKAAVVKSGVTDIAMYSFSDCVNLTSVSISATVTNIGSNAFSGCSRLAAVTIPSSVKSISSGAFQKCANLKAITIPSSVTSVGNSAFAYCAHLTSADIPASIKSFSEMVFYYCSSLASVNMPASLTSINSSAFEGCSSLTSVTIPPSVTSIGASAFASCGLTSVTIPLSIKSLPNFIFSKCGDLTTITIPTSVTSIGDYAFAYCSSLTSVTIPASVISIGGSTFAYCSNLTSVTNCSVIPQSISSSTFNAANIDLAVPTSSLERYKTHAEWGKFKRCTGGGALLSASANNARLGSVAGAGLMQLYPVGTEVQLTATPAAGHSFLGWASGSANFGATASLTFKLTQDTVLTANFGAVGACKVETAGNLKKEANITTVSHLTLTGQINARDVKFMRDSMPYLTELDLSGATIVAYKGSDGTGSSSSEISYPANGLPQYAFQSKTSLFSVKLPTNLTSIGADAFNNCSGMRFITIPSSLKTVGSEAFYRCSALCAVALPPSVTSIGVRAFMGCKSLTSFTVPASLTAISGYTFSECSGLRSISIPPLVTTIGEYAFQSCPSLQSATISASVTSIGKYAFQNCGALQSISIPASVTTISEYAFYNCSRLAYVTISSSVATIGNNAFASCSGLISITNCRPTPQTPSSNVFSGVATKNVELIVPVSALPRYKAAEVWENFTTITGGVLLNAKVDKVTPWGSVAGIGVYPAGSPVSLTATPNKDCNFLRWTNGNGVNIGADHVSFILTQDTAFTAYFGKAGSCNLAAAGTLAGKISDRDITHLTLTGKIDARDVKFMRDSMNYLAELDLTGATVVEYTGTEGTTTSDMTYPANEMPQASFFSAGRGKTTLVSVKLPSSITSIGETAFRACTGIAAINIPTSVTSIGGSAFYACTDLTSVTIPTSVISIGSSTFYNCTNLTSVAIPTSVTSIGNLAFANCNSLTSVVIPASVATVGGSAFASCLGLTTITISSSTTFFNNYVFEKCTGLTSVNNLSPTPQRINTSTFSNVATDNVALRVPSSAESEYKNTALWQDFKFATGSFLLSTNVNGIAGGVISGNKPGLYASGQTVTLTAEPAPGYAFVCWKNGSTVLGIEKTFTFNILQDATLTAYFGAIGSYHLASANTLKDVSDIAMVSRLTLTGVIDARDVKFMRDNMPILTELDLSGATIAAYKGTDGTTTAVTNYYANEMPPNSFYNGSTGKAFFASITLPNTLVSIGANAFRGCTDLASVTNFNLTPQTIVATNNVFQNVSITACVLRVMKSALTKYGAADVWKDFGVKQPISYALMAEHLDYTFAAAPYSGAPQVVAPPTLKSKYGSLGKIGAVTLYYTGVDGTSYGKSKSAPTDVGTYAITVDITGSDNFDDVSNLKLANFTIKKKNITVSGGAIEKKTYNGTTATTITKLTFDGLVGNSELALDLDYTLSGAAFADANAGAGNRIARMTVALKSSDKTGSYTLINGTNYSLMGQTITKATLTTEHLSYTLPSVVEYDGNPHGVENPILQDKYTGIGVITLYYTGVKGTSYAKNTAAPVNAGIYAVTADITGSSNFDNVSNLTLGEFTIHRQTKSITVSGGAIEAKTYDGTTTATVTSLTFDGLTNGDNFVFGTDYAVSNAAFIDAGAGSGNKVVQMTVTLTNSDKANAYSLTNGANYFLVGQTIAKATLTAGHLSYALPSNVVYDGSPHGMANPTPRPGYTDLGSITLYYAGASGTSYAKNIAAPVNAGTYAITMNVAGSGNFADVADFKLGEFTIQEKPKVNITVSGGAAEAKTYDGTTAATVTSLTFDGLANGDNLVLGTDYAVSSAAFTDANAGNGD
ncbi:MAG: leucine-rich repeat protein, partial [Prevotellaceae bacterium]|nr:leucine-rich repeat protein [Prevotellaceae bacterium]